MKRQLHNYVYSNVIHHCQEVEATQVFIDGWINKQQGLYIQWNIIHWEKILSHATACMNLLDIMLSKINQAQEDKYW